MTIKKLEKIKEKFSVSSHNENNYEIGGGLDDCKFASRRHEDAINDSGKRTLGQTVQMFKRATGLETKTVKEIILHAMESELEWHHAGKLPKEYGGGMKKTYFVNAAQICTLVDNWNEITFSLENHKREKELEKENQKTVQQKQQEFLNKHGTFISRTLSKPEHFYEMEREMNGKYGWFDCTGKDYNLPIYYSGYKFESWGKLKEFYSIQ